MKSLIPANLIAGFKACGIYPFDRNAVKAVPILEINGSKKASDNLEKTSKAKALPEKDTPVAGIAKDTSEGLDTESEDEIFSAEQEQLFT